MLRFLVLSKLINIKRLQALIKLKVIRRMARAKLLKRQSAIKEAFGILKARIKQEILAILAKV